MIGYILAAYFILYFTAAFALPSYRVWKNTGVNPVTFDSSDTAHDYIGKLFKIVITGLFVTILVYAFAPQYNKVLLPVMWLENKMIQMLGGGLLVLSLCWIVLAQIQMGDSWRIGIDEEEKTPLIRTGIFGISRNPVFLGMIVTLIGFFLVLPNALMLLALVTGFVLLQIQVRLEEEFLKSVHGEEYNEFSKKVRRWV
jgi:protein-S-isoprenylcysteine O-methyltransferase Ste14